MAHDPAFVEELLRYLMGRMVEAGDYASQIQDRLVCRKGKQGGNLFSEALTDADVAIQGFFEVALLGRYPQLAFFGEEYESSINTKYFPKSADYEVTLDPINGTRFYIDGLRLFDIIVGVLHHGVLVGAATYFPGQDQCYWAVKGVGAFESNRLAMTGGGECKRLAIPRTCNKLIVFGSSTPVFPQLREDFDVKEILKEYRPETWCINNASIFKGECCGFVASPANLIDGIAVGFIVNEAGGIMTDFDGRPIKSFSESRSRYAPNMVVAANPAVHGKILEAIGSERSSSTLAS